MNMSDLNKTKGCFLALGTFDGLHLGHKKVMTAGENKKRYALLFSQHPQTALTGKAPTALITKRLEKKLLEKWGVTPIYIDFRDVMSQSPEEFFENIIKNIAPSEISVGFNYRFGKNAEGDVNKLSKLSNENGIKLFVADAVNFEGEPISSTRIRKSITLGEIEKANTMLGRDFCYDFTVVHGDKRGRTMGSPTINQFFDDGFTVPAYGVYASFCEVNGKVYPAVTNIGIRPTVGSSKERSETHILNFSGDLYGENITVMPKVRMRGEMKFSDISELSDRIDADKKTAETLLEELYSE